VTALHLDAASADRLVDLLLSSLTREYPNRIGHVLHSDDDAQPPRRLTPVFYGHYDWHSSVHSHWALLRLLNRQPGRPWADRVRQALAASFTADRIAGELRYLTVPGREQFEMPYGMAWLLTLAAEPNPWRHALAPLEQLAAQRVQSWLGRLPLPIRSGEHSQSAFAMGLTLDYARAVGNRALEATVVDRARAFYLCDRNAPVAYEPSAHDFLSPALAEADLMRRVLAGDEWASWLAGFLPVVEFEPVTTADRQDGKLCHFDGLNLSRAWMLRALGHPRLAEAHAAAGLAGVSGAHYAGAHWLGSFAVYWFTHK
jgi:hypothetical protein